MVKNEKYSLRLEHLWVLTVIAGIFIFVNTHPIRPHDFWWHITVGKEILETHRIPTVDHYSYTMSGQPYPSYQMFWLMEVLFSGLFDLGGAALVVFIQSVIITAAYAILVVTIYLRTDSWRLAAAGGLFAAALGINDWNVRPQSITFLLGSISLWAIYSFRQKSDWKYLLALPIAMLVWVNSHGTFLIGILLVGIWFMDELWVYLWSQRTGKSGDRRNVLFSALALGSTSLAIFVNPGGSGIFRYLRTMGGNPVVQNLVVEWAPPTINSLFGALFYIALLLLVVVMFVSPRRPDLFELLMFVAFAILGIRTSRGIIWFGLVAGPILAQHLRSILDRYGSSALPRTNQESTLMNRIVVGLLALLAIVSLPWFKDSLPLPAAKAGLISSETPVQATDFLLQERMPTQVFHAMSFGSYLIWAAQPSYKVFVDPRIELYTIEIWKDYLIISNAQGDWEQKLDEYGVNTLMLSLNEQALLVEKARSSNNWLSVYKDGVSEIFKRAGIENVRKSFTNEDIRSSKWGMRRVDEIYPRAFIIGRE